MKIYCIHLPKDADRRKSIESQDFLFPVEFVVANGVTGSGSIVQRILENLTESHASIMEDHLARYGDAPFLILEDDAVIEDAAKYAETISNPPRGCTSMGSVLCERNVFVGTHAMLINGVTSDMIEEFRSALFGTPLEPRYARAFKPLTITESIVVNVGSFISNRTRRPQKPYEQLSN